MPDIRLTPGSRGLADVSIEANDLQVDDGLKTAIILSLFTDRRAELSDTLPDGQTDRRGWWADAVPVVAGDRFGSRLWLLDRSKQTADTLERAQAYAQESLQWLIDDRVTDSVTVVAEFIQPNLGLGLAVSARRPGGDLVKFRFDYTWAAEGLEA